MTTLRPYRQMRQQVAFTMIVALAFGQVRSSAALVYLNGRGDGLNSPLSYQKWTPLSSGDTLVWSGPIPGGAATVNGLVSGSGSLNLEGIVVTNTANGALTLQPANPTGASLQTINLGGGGLDLSEANQNLTINKTNGSGTLALNLTAAQVWDVGPGRTLTVNADTTSTHQLTLSTLGASAGITVGGALSMPTAALVINKQGTGNIALNGAVSAQSINAVNEVTGNISFGSTVVAPTINIVNKNTGSLSFSSTVTATNAITIDSLSSGGVTFSNDVTTNAFTLNTNSSAAVSFTRKLTADTINLTHNSTGTVNFLDPSATAITASSVFNYTTTRSGATTFNGGITAPTFNLTTLGTGGVTFNSTGIVNAATAFNIDARAANTITFNGNVNTAALNATTLGGLVVNASSTVTAPVVNVTTKGTTASTVAGTVNASSSFTWTGLSNNTTTFSGNVVSPVIALTNTGTMNLNGQMTGFNSFSLTHKGTGSVTFANSAGDRLSGNNNSAVNLTNFTTGTITIGGPLGGGIAGAGTSLNIVSTGATTAGGIVNLRANNSFTGATSITGGTVNLDYSTTGANGGKLWDSAPLTLNRATLNIVGAVSAGHNEVVANTVIGSGFSRITRSTGTGTLQLNQLTRAVGGVLDLGTASIATTDRTNTNGIIGGWATLNGSDWAINSTNVADGAITAFTAYTTNLAANTWTTATQNVRANAALTGTAGNGTINSLKLDTVAHTLNQTAATTLTIGSGGILTTGNFNRTLGTAGANLTAGTVAAATAYNAGAAHADLFFHLNQLTANPVTVNSTIIDNTALTPTTVGLVKTQGGLLILTANNTYTGPTTIAGGQLQLGNNTTTGSINSTSAVVNDGLLIFNRSNAVAFPNNITGIGGVTKNNTTAGATLTLSGVNTYYGATNVTQGAVIAGSATGLSPNSNFVFPASGTSSLELNGFNAEIGGLEGGLATSTVSLGSNTLTLGNKNLTQTYAGVITGSGNILKKGNGTLTLSGNNTYTGTYTQDAGATTISGTSAISGATVNLGTLTLSNATNYTIGGPVSVNNGLLTVTGAGVKTITGPVVVNNSATFNTTSTTAGAGVVFDSTVDINDVAVMTLANLGTFNGAVNVNDGGTLTLSSTTVAKLFNAGLTVAPSGIVTLSGPNTYGGSGLTLNNAGSLTLAQANIFNGPLTIAGPVALTLSSTTTSNTFASTVNVTGGSLAVSHANPVFQGLVTMSSPTTLSITGTGGTSTFGAGVQVTNGAFTVAGATNITGGGLTISNLGSATLTGAAVINGDLNVSGVRTSTFTGGVTVNGNSSLASTRALVFGGNNTFNGNVLFNNAGTINFSGTTAITGAVTINQGTVVIPGTTPVTGITVNGGSLTIGPAVGSPAIPISINGSGSLLQITESTTASGAFNVPFGSLLLVASGKEFAFSTAVDQTLEGLVGGGGGLVKSGAGTLTIASPMSFQGNLNINQGAVTLTPSSSFPGISSILPDRSTINLAAGTTLNINGFREKVGAVLGDGAVDLGAGGGLILGGNDSSGILSGGISGTGSNTLIKQGAGTLTLTGAGSFNGSVTVEGGALVAANPAGSAIGDTTNVAISRPGATFSVSTNETVGSVTGVFGSTLNIGAGATLTTSYTDSSAGAISGTLVGGTRIVSDLDDPGTRNLISSMFISNSNFIYDPSWVVQVIGTGQDGSPGLVLSASVQQPGGSGTLNFTRVGLLASNLTGAGDFVKNGPGSLMMLGSNTNTGKTIINNGNIQLGGIEASGRYVHQNILSDQSQLTFGTTGNQTVNLADNASNLQSFERVGSISGGSLLGFSIINLINGATDAEKSIGALVVGADNTSTTFRGQINGTDALAVDQPGRSFFMKEGTGTFSFISTGGGFDGTTRVQAGTLAFPSGSGLKGNRGNVVISNDTTAVFDTIVQQSVLSLAGGPGVTTSFRTGTVGALAGNRLGETGGEIKVSSAGISFNVNTNNGEHAFSGRITGPGGFAKSDVHTAYLMGANTYTGDTQISGGVLHMGYLSRGAGVGDLRLADYVGSLSSSTLVTMTSGSLVLNNLNIGVRSLNSSAQLARVVLGNGTLTLNGANGEDYAGTIRSNGLGLGTGLGLPNVGVLEVKGGIFNLLNRDTSDPLSSNLATIDGPRLVIGNGGNVRLGPTSSVGGGSLADTTWVTVETGGTLSFRSENVTGEVIGSLQGSGTVDLGSAGRTLELTQAGGASHGTFTGVITGTGNVKLNGPGSLVLSGTNTYNGTTQLTSGASITLVTGTTPGTSTILPDTTVLRLGQGLVRLRGMNTENVGSTTLDSGMNRVVRDFGSTAVLNLGAITVNSGGALLVSPESATTTNVNTNGILGGYALAGAGSWAQNNGAGVITALDDSSYSTLWGALNHTAVDDLDGDGNITVTNATTSTLRFGASVTSFNQNIDLKINQTATIAQGGILMTREFGVFDAIISPGINTPKLVSGTDHLYLHQFNEQGKLTVGVRIQDGVNPLHVVKTGPGKVVFTANNLFSGSLTIAGGTLQAGDGSFSGGALLGSTSAPITNNGVLAFNTGAGSAEVTVFNQVVGSGAIRQIGDGDAALTAASTYTGRTSVMSGKLSVTHPLALGSSLGLTAVSEQGKLVISGDGGLTTTPERIVLKGGTLELTNGAVLGGQIIVTADSTVGALGGSVSLRGSIISPQGQRVLLNAPGNNGVISLFETNYWGGVELGAGELVLRSGDLGRGEVVHNGTDITIDITDAFRVLANDISGTGSLTQLANDLYLTGNNTFEGGINVSLDGTTRAVLHIGSDTFTGSAGTGPILVTSPTNNNSQIRFHRANTLVAPNTITLKPNDSDGPLGATGTTPRNADLVKEGAGNLFLTGEIIAGPHGGANNEPNTQRALITANSGRLIFEDTVFTNSADSSLAINNNAHIEFLGADAFVQSGTIFGALGGGGTWVLNSGVVKLNNTGTTGSGWNGNVFLRKGELQTLAADQLGDDLDLIINSGASMLVGAADTVGNIFLQKGSVLETGVNTRLDDGDEKILSGYITGSGDLTVQSGTVNLYGTDNDFSGDLRIVGATARVMSLGNVSQSSAAGSGSTIIFSEPGSTSSGTLEYIGDGDTSNKDIQLAADSASPATVNGTIFSNGTGALTLTGSVTALSSLQSLTLSTNNNLNNTFTGNIQSGIELIKSGTGTWILGGTRAAYTGTVTAANGILQLSSLAPLGNMGAGVSRTFGLSGGTFRFVNPTAGTDTFNSLKTFYIRGTGGFTNDGASTLVFDGSILQPMGNNVLGAAESTASRNLVLDGTNATDNTINGTITGTVAGQSTNIGIVKNGTGKWIINNSANNLTGATTINSGTLVINGGNALADVGTVTLSNAAVNGLAYSGARLNVLDNETVGALAGAIGTVVDIASGKILSLVAGSGTFQGVIQGGGGLTVSSNTNNSARVAALSNINTFSGPVSILGGTASDRSAANRIDVYYLANGGLDSGIGNSSNAAANLTMNTNGKGGGLRYIGFETASTDRLFTLGVGNGSTIGESAASIWADGQITGNKVPTLSFTNTGALAFTGSGNRKLTLRGGNRGDGVSFNTFSPAIADGPGGSTSLGKTEDSIWLVNGNNSFTGAVSIERGTLIVGSNTALGTSAGGVTVTQASNDTRAFLDLRNGVTVTGESLTLTGGANNTGNGWGASSGVNVWTGTVANNGGNGIWSVLGETTSLRVTGVISGGNTVNKVGNGTLELAGSNTFSGQFNAMGGKLVLDYLTNNNSKLADGAALTVGGTGATATQVGIARGGAGAVFQAGTTFELRGGSHTETVSSTTLNAGASYLTRPSGTARLHFAGITHNIGATLDVAGAGMALTNTLNNTTVLGLVGGWLTVGKTDFGASGTFGVDLPITATTSYVQSTTANVSWNNAGNQNAVLDVLSDIMGTGNVGAVRFNQAAARTVTMQNTSIIKTGGILVTPNVGANTITLTASPMTSFSVTGCNTTASSATINCTSTAGLLPGMVITGTGIPAGRTVAAIASNTQFTINSGTGVTLQSNQTYTASVLTSLTNVVTAPGSTTVRCDTTVGLLVNTMITCPNIPEGAIVTSITNSTNFVISLPATADGSGLVATLSGGITTDNLGSATRSLLVHQHNPLAPLVINAPLTNNTTNAVGLTKTGAGELIMTGLNAQTGGVYVNEGTLRIGQNGTPNAAPGGTGAVQVNGTLIISSSGAERVLASGGAFRGNGTVTFDEFNTRTWVVSGDNGGFGGTLNVYGGKLALAQNPGDTNNNGFGSSRGMITVGPLGTIELRGKTDNTEENGVNQNITLYGTVRAEYLSTAANTSTARLQGVITIPDVIAPGVGGTAGAATNAKFDVSGANSLLLLNNVIDTNTGFTKIGDGRLQLNAQQADSTLIGDTGRSAGYTLFGQIKVNEGELWLSTAGNRVAGAPGVGNEIIVASGATLDLRDADLNYGDDADTSRKIIEIIGTGMNNMGALRNSTGTANFSHLVLNGDATVGVGSLLTGGRLDLNVYDTETDTGASVGELVNYQAPTLISSGGSHVLTKVGSGDFVLHDAIITGFESFDVKEGELRIEMNNAPNAVAMSGALTTAAVQQINIAYSGPGLVDMLNPSSGLGPIVGARLEFYRNVDLHHEVPIFMDGATAQANNGTNYIDLSSDTVPGPRTYLDGTITVSGAEAKRNIFNIDGGVSNTTTIAEQGNQTVNVQAKMIIGGQIVGTGGISKIGFRELRLTNNNTYTGDTIITRSGNQALPSRSDTVTINGVNYTTYGEAESWGEWGMTLNGNGRLSGTSNIILQRTGMLTLDNSNRLDASSATTGANLGDRVNDNANILMSQGWLRLIGSTTDDTSEALATGSGKSLQALAGANIIDLWSPENSNQDMMLTLGKIQLSPGSVLRFRNLNADSNFTATSNGEDNEEDVRVKVNDSTGLTQVGSGASATSLPIVHGVLGGSSPNNVYEDTRVTTDLYSQDRNRQNATGSGFMTLDNNGYLRPLDDSEYATTTTGMVDSALAGQNVNLTDFNHYMLDSVSVNSLRFGPAIDYDDSGSAGDSTRLTSYTSNWQPTLILDDEAVLTVASGMISSATFSHFGTGINNSTFIRGGTLNFGAREGIINNQNYSIRLTDGTYQSNNFEIQSIIAGSAGITKVGNPSVVFDAKNTYTGRTTVNEGVLFARNGRNAFGANGRAAGNTPHTGNDILINGGGDLRLTNGVQIGTAGAFKDLTIGIMNGDNQALRSENGNNHFYGNIKLDNVDAVGQTGHVGRPRISVNTNQSLSIFGDIYAASAEVTQDITIAEPRTLSLNGAGFISIRGQVGDRLVGSVSSPVANRLSGRETSATETNENAALRLQITANDDLNVSFSNQYNAAGRLSMDRGIMLIDYEPTSLAVGETGFWTQAALSKMGASATTITSNGNAANGNSGNVGFLLANNIGDGGGTAAVFLTKPGQVFNMPEWRFSSNHGGAAWIGGTNDSGTVSFGQVAGANVNSSANLSLDKTARFYAMVGGTVNINHRLNGGSFIKVGRGTVVLQNTVSTTGSDTHSFELGGGTLVLDMNGQTAARVGNQGNFTASGGNLIIQGMNDANAADASVTVSTNTDADRIVRFNSGLTQFIAEARGSKNVTFTLGNSRSTGTALLQRTIGATAAFVAYNSAVGGTGTAVINFNFNDGNLVVNAHKNAVIPWGVVGSLPDEASDFLMVDGTSSNRARTFNRALDEYKNDVTTWAMGEDLSEGGADAAGAVYYGQLASGATIATLRFNTPSDSALNNGLGQNLFLANSGLLVTTNSGAANKTISGGRLTTSFISTAGVTLNSDVVTGLSDTSSLYVGMPISGQNIPVGTFVQEILSATSVRLTRAATATNASQGLQFGTAELIVHHYGQGDLTINSGLGEGPTTVKNISTTIGSTTLTLPNTVGVEIGMRVTGPGIMSGTTVSAVVNATTVTMSLPAYSTVTGEALRVLPKGTAPATISGAATVMGSKIVDVSDMSAEYADWVKPGLVVTGNGIPPGTMIASVNSATQITLTNNATATDSGVVLYIVRPNDPISGAVAFTGGATNSGSATGSVTDVTNMKPGMGITGTGIPNGTRVKAVTTDGSNDFTLSQNAASTQSNQTYQGVFGALALTAGSTNGTTTVTVASTAGMQTGMLVMMPGVPNGATVTIVSNSTQFVISLPATTTASGLSGYAQLPFAMPVLLTNGETFTTPGNTDKVSVASTAGLVAGLSIVGPNLKSGTTIKTIVNSTDLQISTETLAASSGLTFVVGQPSFLPITMVGGVTTSGSNVLTVASTVGVSEGLVLNGTNIPASTTVASVDSSTQITMSANATADGTGLSIAALSPMSLTVSGPSTTSPGEFDSVGAVVLTNETNFYGGRTVVNGGILSVSDMAALGPNPAAEVANQVTLSGGTFRWTGTNGQFSQTRGLTLQGSGGTIEVVDPQANLMIQRGIVSQELYRGDLIKTGQGTLTFEGESGGNQSNFQGLLDVREGTLRVAGDNPSGSAGDTTIFGSNFTWADGTVLRSGSRLMLQMGNANGGGDWNFLDFLTTEGNNLITVGTLGAAVRPMNWNAPIAINGTTTFDVVPGQTFRLNNGGGFVQGNGNIIKDGLGQMEFRENIPDWKGGLTILQGRVLAANQADVLGTGHTVGKSITLGSTEHQSTADLLIHPDLGVAGAVYEVNMPINVVFNPAQTKRIGALSQQGQGGQDLAFNGDITLNDNLILYYEEGNNGVPVGGEFVHINYNGSFKDGLTTSGNLVAQTREGSPNANDSQNGRFYVYHKLNNNNSAWSGDLVISDNTAYNQDQNTIVRIGHNLALTEKNDVTMYYNSILQAGGFSATIGSLSTKGGDGQFLGNAGTQSASANASTEIIENAASTVGTIRINQATPATAEVAWDAMFRDGTLASHWVVPGQSAAAASLNLVKGGDGWATLTLDNDYSGTTTVAAGILQVGRNGIGDTGTLRLQTDAGTTVLQAATLAGTGTVHGASLINGALKPGDVGGEAMGTINFSGDVVFGATSVTTLQIQRASFNVPELLSADTGEFYNAQRDALLVNQTSTYYGELDTPVSTDQHDRVSIGGSAQAQAGARFRLLLNGYTPVAGDVFKLLDFAYTLDALGAPGALAISVGSQFRFGGEGGTDLDLPYLGDSFQWDTGLFRDYGILSVVDLRGEGEPPEGIILTSTPGNTLVPFGQSATFSIGAVGYPQPITYTMKRNNVALPTGGAQTWTTPVITATNAASIVGKYVGTATNSVTSKSSDNGLAANQAILAAVDTTTTKSIYIAPNGTTTFTVVTAAPSGVVLQYQWRKDGVAISNTTKYAGATTNKLTLKAFTATEAGVYTCLVTLPASGGGAARFLESGTNTALLAALPDLLAPALPKGAVGTPYNSPAVGYQFPFNPDPAKAPTKWVATGLPAGLTINATTGVISGSPTTATSVLPAKTVRYDKIYITATGVAGSRKVGPYSIEVDPINDEAVGTFVGLVERSGVLGTGSTGTNGNGTRTLGARLDVTTTKTASWTGKLTIGTVVYPLSGTLNTASSSPRGTFNITRKNGQSTLALTFDIDTTGTKLLTGTLTDSIPTTASISGWRLVWGTKSPLVAATARLGVHNIMATIPASLEGDDAHPDIPQGDTHFTATVATSGSVTVKGKAADGTAIATTAPMGPTGQFLVYQAMYPTTAQGSMIGTPQIDDTANVHAVTGALTWSRPAQATTIKLYQAGWAVPITLDVTGGLYVKPVTGAIVMGARTPPTSVLYNGSINSTITFFSSTGIPSTASVVNPNLDANNTLGELNGLRINSPGTVIKPTATNAAPLATTNPASVVLTVTSTTGAITGSFKLKDGTVSRTVTYYGLIVPDVSTPNPLDAVGVGYYILTGAPTTAPSKSGRVTLLPIFP